LDGDEAGQRRTNEVLEMFVASEVDLRIATLPDELDPCEFLEQRPADDLRQLFDGAQDAFEHAIRVHSRGVDLVGDTHRANQVLERLLGIIGRAPRLTNDSSEGKTLREGQIVRRLARDFGIDDQLLRQRLTELRRDSGGSRLPQVANEPTPLPSITVRDLSPLDAELCEVLVRNPSLVDVALADLTIEHISPGPAQRLFAAFKAVADRGEIAEFLHVLDELEEPRLKSLLVELDERASSKEAHAHADAATRLRQLIENVQYRFQASSRRQQLALLEQKRLDETEELTLLHQLVEQERRRQGIPAPTDG
jgi:DNA primase